jgi:hypothetical protein
MALRVMTKLPGGNATGVSVHADGDVPEVRFAPSPRGGAQALWFRFRVVESEPETAHPDRFRLVLQNFQNLPGADQPSACIPVYRAPEQGWSRMKPGAARNEPDGRLAACWTLYYPAPHLDIAFCFPYEQDQVRTLVRKSRDYWHLDTIGVTRGGKPIQRLANDYGADKKRPGLYLIARRHAGETPGSWVLDGVLEYFSRAKRNPFTIWAIPLADIDGIQRGDYGRNAFPVDFHHAWGTPALRHETQVIQKDIARWQDRTTPFLALDFGAPGSCDTDGVHTVVPANDADDTLKKNTEKWNNVFKDALGADYAASDFARLSDTPTRWTSPGFVEFMRSHGMDALCLETPYAMIGRTVLTVKRYREIGRHIADAILRRLGKG